MKKESTINTYKATENRVLFTLILIYLFIITGTIITTIPPQWLVNISSEGKYSEALQYANYGDIYLSKGEFDMAISQYKKSIEIDPNIQEVYINISIAYSNINNLKLALTYLEKAITFKDKSMSSTYFNIAKVYKKNNQFKKAIKYYQKSTETSGFPIYAYQNMGELENNLKDWDQAIESFQKAIILKFSMKNCYKGMLIYDQELMYEESAKAELRLQYEIGIENIDLSSYDETAFADALAHNGVMASILNQYGYALAMQGNMKEAIEKFQEALQLKPKFKEAKDNLNAALSFLKKQ